MPWRRLQVAGGLRYHTTRLPTVPHPVAQETRARPHEKQDNPPRESRLLPEHTCVYLHTPRSPPPPPHGRNGGTSHRTLSGWMQGRRAGGVLRGCGRGPYIYVPSTPHPQRPEKRGRRSRASIHPSIHMQLPLPRDSSKKKKGGMMWGGDASGKPAPRRKLCGRLWGAGCSHTLRSLIAAGEISPR